MAEENFSYPLIGGQPNSHINCLFDGRTSKPAAEPLQRAVPSPVALGFQYGRRRLARNVIWFGVNLLATANALFSHVSKAIF